MAYAEPVIEHHHIDETNNSSGAPMVLIGIILFAVLAFLFVVFALPYIQNMGNPSVNIPDQVDLNINRSE